jgi:hypothetical protein
MNPADEAQAFASLVDSGASIEDVARRFGLTVRFVEGRLRLATLAPVVFEALASGEITLDIAKAFGATSDQEIQARVFEQASSGYYAPSPDSIRRMVLSGTVRAAIRAPGSSVAMPISRPAAGSNANCSTTMTASPGSMSRFSKASPRRDGRAGQGARRRAGSRLGQPTLDPMPATISSKDWSGFPPNRRR